jgi:hypothetical protein
MEKLYNKLHEQGLYTKSFEDFKVQFNNEESVGKLYSSLHSSGLYTKSQNEFVDQFGFQVGKTEGAQDAAVTVAPEQEQADTTKYTDQLENAFKGSSEEDPMEATRKAREYELNNQTWVERTFGRNPLTEFAGDMYRAAAGGFTAGDVSDEALDLLSGFTNEEDIEEWIEAHEASSQYQQSDEMAEFNRIADEEGIWSFVTKAITEKQSLLKIAPEIMIQSVAQMLGSESALATGGAVVGTGAAIGAVGGAGVLSAATAGAGAVASIPTAYAAAGATIEAGMSFSGYIDEELQKRGLELNKYNVKTLLEDDDFVTAARAKAAARGVVIGAVDRMTAGLGAKVGAKLGAKTLKNVGAQVVLEGTGGAGGEAIAQLVTEGEIETKEVFLEGLGETPGAAINITKSVLQSALPGEYKIEGQKVGKEEINSAIDNFEDSDFAKTNFDIKNNPALKQKVEKRKTELREKAEAFESKQVEIKEQVDVDNSSDEAKIKELRGKLKENPNQQKEILDEIKSLREGIENRNASIQESAALLESVKKGYVNEKLGKNIDFAKRYAKFFNLEVIDNLTQEELIDEYGLDKKRVKTVVGFINDGKIVINRAAALNQIDVNVGSHELLHGIMTSVFKNINKATGINSKNDLVDSFLEKLNEADRQKLQDAVEATNENNERIYSEEYLQENPDEYLTQFSDLVNNGEIKFDENTFEQLGDYFTPMFRMFGMKKMKFRDGQDVYDFMKEYQKSIKSGKLHKSFIAAAGGDVSGVGIQVDEIIPTGSVAAVTKEEEPVEAEVVQETKPKAKPSPKTKPKPEAKREPSAKKEKDTIVPPRRPAATSMGSVSDLTKEEFAKMFKNKYKTPEEVDAKYKMYVDQKSKRRSADLEAAAAQAAFEAEREIKTRRSEKIRRSEKRSTIGEQIKAIVPDGTTKAEYDDFIVVEAYQRLVAGSMLHNMIEKQLRNKGGIMEDQVVDGFLEDVKSNLMERSLMRFNPEKNDDFGGFVIKELTSYSIPNIIKEYKKQGKIVSEDVAVPARSLDESREGSQPMQVASDEVTQEEQLDITMQEEATAQEKTFREKLGIIEEDSPDYNSIFYTVTRAFGTALDQVKPDKIKYRVANRTDFRKQLIEQYRDNIMPIIRRILGGDSMKSKFYVDFLNNNMDVILEKIPLRDFVQMERFEKEKIFAKIVKKNANPTEIRKALAEGNYVQESVSLTAGNSIYEPLKPTQEQFNKFFLYNVGRKKILAKRIATELAFDATIVALQDYEIIDKYNEILELQGKTVVDNTLAEVAKVLDRDPRSVRWSVYASPNDKKLFETKLAELTDELNSEDSKKEIRKAFNKVFPNHNWDNNYDDLLVNYIDKRLKEEVKARKKSKDRFVEKTKQENKIRYSIVYSNANLKDQVKQDRGKAVLLSTNGVDPLSIKQQTGWEKTADGKWGYEVDPEIDTIVSAIEKVSNEIVETKAKEKDVLLSELLPEKYFDFYPDLKDARVVFTDSIPLDQAKISYIKTSFKISVGTEGLQSAKSKDIKQGYEGLLFEINKPDATFAIAGSLLHEVQHAIQIKSFVELGANEAQFLSQKGKDFKQEVDRLRAISELTPREKEDLEFNIKVYEEETKKAFVLYKQTIGETQARSIEERMFLTKEERRDILMLDDERFTTKKLKRQDKLTREERNALTDGDNWKEYQITRAQAQTIVDKQDAEYEAEILKSAGVKQIRRSEKGSSPKKPFTQPQESKSLKQFLNQLGVEENEFVKEDDKKADPINSQVFNRILEITRGVDRFKEFTKTQAAVASQKKKRRTFFIAPSAEDFVGLLYAFLAPGKIGDEQFQFFKNTLIDPFNVAMNNLAAARQKLGKSYKALKKKYPNVRKNLYNTIEGMDFTYDQAIRVYLYDLAGYNPKGLDEKELKSIIRFVSSNPEVKAFADGVRSITAVEGGFKKPDEFWVNDTLASELYEISQKVNRAQFLENTNWKKNKDEIFSEKNLNKIESEYGPGFRSALEDMLYRMETGSNRNFGKNKLLNQFNDWINGSVGAIMFLNTRSAVLQTISAINYINWSDNNMLAAAKAFADQKQFWSDFTFLFNSDYLKERRSGLQSDINLAELQSAVAGKNNKAKAAINWLLQKGFTPTQMADSFAIAIGGSSFYRNRLKKYENEGLSTKEAQSKAFTDFQALTETAQQSSRPDKISQQQAGPLGRLILAFQNTPAQYAREMKKASLDLINNRGDFKTNISKIIYYGAVQNLIFNTLQTALFAALFDDDEDGEEEKLDIKKERVINGMIDSILRGSGIGGAIVATTKNLILEFMEQNKKDYNFDSGSVVVEALNLSPPIGSKARKLKNALDTYKYNREYMKEYGFDIDNPAVSATSNLVSAATNVPIDRAVRKVQNVQGALNSENKTWERIALMLGWSKWDVGIKDEKIEQVKAQVKADKKAERKIGRKINEDEVSERKITTRKITKR